MPWQMQRCCDSLVLHQAIALLNRESIGIVAPQAWVHTDGLPSQEHESLGHSSLHLTFSTWATRIGSKARVQRGGGQIKVTYTVCAVVTGHI